MQSFSSPPPQQGLHNKCNFPYYKKYISENTFLNEKDLDQYKFLEAVSYYLFVVKVVGCILLFLIFMFGANIYFKEKESRGDLFFFFKYVFCPLCIIIIVIFAVHPIVQKKMKEIEKKASRPCMNVYQNQLYT